MLTITTLFGPLKSLKASCCLTVTKATTALTANNSRCSKKTFLLLTYKGQKGEHLIKSMKRRISKLLLLKIKTQVVYTGKKQSKRSK